MYIKSRKAFTMIELVFVIVIIGILSAIAIPKLAATRDDAVITNARITVSSIRSAISTERQKRILRGDFTAITDLAQTAGLVFDTFNVDNLGNNNPILEYPLSACAGANNRGCWVEVAGPLYQYRFPHNATNVDFNITGSRFDCVAATAAADCALLTR